MAIKIENATRKWVADNMKDTQVFVDVFGNIVYYLYCIDGILMSQKEAVCKDYTAEDKVFLAKGKKFYMTKKVLQTIEKYDISCCETLRFSFYHRAVDDMWNHVQKYRDTRK